MISNILMLLIFIFCSFYVFYPLFDGFKKENNTNLKDLQLIEINKKNIVKQIEQLEFEKDIGIITKEDYKLTKYDLLLESTKYFNNNSKNKKNESDT